MTSRLPARIPLWWVAWLAVGLAACQAQPAPALTAALPTRLPSPSPTLPITPFPTLPEVTPAPAVPSPARPMATVSPSPSPTPLPTSVMSLPNPQEYTWEVIAEGFDRPTALVSVPDGSGRLFVLEQGGLIHVLAAGARIPRPFLDLRERASTQGSTVRGLLGMAFHPGYIENGYFFVHYTRSGGDSVIARYQVSGDPNMADPDSEVILFEIDYPVGEHLGGEMAFGPDGYLYLSIGDGGGGGYDDAEGNAQNPATLLGSILRIDVDRGNPYAIPPDNPLRMGGGRPEVWVWGLRNPWRFSFDPLNGDLYIADVGENQWEEIDYLPAGSPGGANFGWNFYEGNHAYSGQPRAGLEFVMPVWEYDHSLGCSVTGGKVYRGNSLPEWFGVYLFGDYCTGNVWGLLHLPDGNWQAGLLFQAPAYITSFGQDQRGEVYLVDLTGEILKLVKK